MSFTILSNLFKNISLKNILYIIGVIATAYFLYQWHYLPIKKYQKLIQEYEMNSSICQRSLSNSQERLKKCQGDLQTQILNLELCNMQFDAYDEINTTTKDNSNEGYLIF